MNTLSKPGKLWIVATPLGNHGDLSPRAAEILAGVDLVLAEDTRRSGLLFSRLNIKGNGFLSFHDHNEAERIPRIISLLQGGHEIALVSDAGTPLLSDPGYRLVRACRQSGIEVSPVPGPSAPIAALSASGLPPLPFTFLGFAPRKTAEQIPFFQPFSGVISTLIFFERKDRLKKTLETAFSILGNRDACIARELTKTYEEFICFSLEEYNDISNELLGEITVLIGPPQGNKNTREEVSALLLHELTYGSKPKEAAKNVKSMVTGWTTRELYDLLRNLT